MGTRDDRGACSCSQKRALLVKILLFCSVFSFLSVLAFGSENIRVIVADNQKTVTLRSQTGFSGDGRIDGSSRNKLVINAGSVVGRPLRVRASDGFIEVNGKKYRGWVELRKKRNARLQIINDLDIEDYLPGVVSSEIPSGWEYEAVKAQAVAARTYALYQKKTAGRRPYHIHATVNDQVYEGRNAERPESIRAVRDTRGMVIVYEGELIPAFYHASCGGHTEDAFELWGIDAPYLRGVDCECQNISRYGLWEKRIGKVQVMKALQKLGRRTDDISGMSIQGITPAGRVKSISVETSRGKITVPAESLRAALGNTVLPSVFFELEFEAGEAVFSGRGSGHGVGLCQWGAEEMAGRGYDFKSILSYYYPGTRIQQQ